MEKRYIIVSAYTNTNGEVEVFASGQLTHDELMKNYMETFIEEIGSNNLVKMTDYEIYDSITSWENNLSNKIYEMDIQNKTTNIYTIPIEIMKNHVRKCASESMEELSRLFEDYTVKYVRKKSIVEAKQFLQDAEVPVLKLLGLNGNGLHCENKHAKFDCYQPGVSTLILKIHNGEDNCEVDYGDWVVKYWDGEYDVYTDEHFKELYEIVLK